MFYSHQILARKGPLATLWMGHIFSIASRSRTTTLLISIPLSIAKIIWPEAPIALRMSGRARLREMACVGKLLYIVVKDEEEREKAEMNGKELFRYTMYVLQSTLQLMGCKARHAFKISKRVFDMMRRECLGYAFLLMGTDALDSDSFTRKAEENINIAKVNLDRVEKDEPADHEKDGRNKRVPFELYKKRTTVVVNRESFLDVVCDALTEYKYYGPNQRSNLFIKFLQLISN